MAALELAPSLLNADFAALGEQARAALEAGVHRLHVDVMDGQFVPSLSMGPQVVESLRPLADTHAALLEVHLMVVQPERFLADFRRAGADILEVHQEATPHLHRAVEQIRSLGARPCVALNPATPVAMLEELLPELDQVLVMTVDPGFGGQRLIPACLTKVAALRRLLADRGLDHVAVEVDGGVQAHTVGAVACAGAQVAVAGTAVFRAQMPVAEALRTLREAAGAPRAPPQRERPMDGLS
jgi:ribulose-phosphate 3-epimerase